MTPYVTQSDANTYVAMTSTGSSGNQGPTLHTYKSYGNE